MKTSRDRRRPKVRHNSGPGPYALLLDLQVMVNPPRSLRPERWFRPQGNGETGSQRRIQSPFSVVKTLPPVRPSSTGAQEETECALPVLHPPPRITVESLFYFGFRGLGSNGGPARPLLPPPASSKERRRDSSLDPSDPKRGFSCLPPRLPGPPVRSGRGCRDSRGPGHPRTGRLTPARSPAVASKSRAPRDPPWDPKTRHPLLPPLP